MQEAQPSPSKPTNNKHSKYDDWICMFCQNYNYSFRSSCIYLFIKAIDVIYRHDNKIIICSNFINKTKLQYIVVKSC